MTKFLALIAATLLAFAAQAGDDKDKSHDKGMQYDGDVRHARQERRLADQQDRSVVRQQAVG